MGEILSPLDATSGQTREIGNFEIEYQNMLEILQGLRGEEIRSFDKRPSIGTTIGCTKMLSMIARRSGSASILEILTVALVRDHRITTQTQPYSRLRKLCDAGILVRTNRGIYRIVPECEIAFGSLRTADLLCRPRIARAEAADAEFANNEDDHQEAAE